MPLWFDTHVSALEDPVAFSVIIDLRNMSMDENLSTEIDTHLIPVA